MRRDGLPPELVEAKLADLGQGLTVSFRDDTNRAGLGGEWGLRQLFFAGRYEGATAPGRDVRVAQRAARCGCSSAAART